MATTATEQLSLHNNTTFKTAIQLHHEVFEKPQLCHSVDIGTALMHAQLITATTMQLLCAWQLYA
jgi:hypothetical protein